MPILKKSYLFNGIPCVFDFTLKILLAFFLFFYIKTLSIAPT